MPPPHFGGGGGQNSAAAAAAAAADYASWLCRPMGIPGAGYMNLPANFLAARLSKLIF
jgi:hypothetical protein